MLLKDDTIKVGRVRVRARGEHQYHLCWFDDRPIARGVRREEERVSVRVFMHVGPDYLATLSEKALDKFLREAAAKKDRLLATDEPTTPDQRRLRVGDLLEHLRKDLAGENPPETAVPSYASIRSALRWLDGQIGAARALDIDSFALKRLVKKWGRMVNPHDPEGAVYQPATVRDRAIWLVRAYKFAVEERWLAPTHIPLRPKIRGVTEGTREGFLYPEEFYGPLGYEQFGVLAQYGKVSRPKLAARELQYADGTVWCYVAGWRKREMIRLRWDWVHESAGETSFTMPDGTTVAARGYIKLPRDVVKNRKGRRLPIIGPLAEILERRKTARVFVDQRGVTRLSEYVFHQGNGRPLDLKQLNILFRRAIKASPMVEDEKRRFIFHDLRRSALRNLIRSGVDKLVAMKISGHRSASVFDRYDITSLEDTERALVGASTYVEARRASVGLDKATALGLVAGPNVVALTDSSTDSRGRRAHRTAVQVERNTKVS